jgi:hypothetical protein
VHTLQEAVHQDDGSPFLGYWEGSQLLRERPHYLDELEDNVRRLVEECDLAQGFQARARACVRVGDSV